MNRNVRLVGLGLLTLTLLGGIVGMAWYLIQPSTPPVQSVDTPTPTPTSPPLATGTSIDFAATVVAAYQQGMVAGAAMITCVPPCPMATCQACPTCEPSPTPTLTSTPRPWYPSLTPTPTAPAPATQVSLTATPMPTAIPTATPLPTATLLPTWTPVPPTLGVTLRPVPDYGTAPLSVDLQVTVGGTAAGPATYRFDCAGDGVWDQTVTVDSNQASWQCTYVVAGQYSPRVEVTREGLTVGGNATVIVQ